MTSVLLLAASLLPGQAKDLSPGDLTREVRRLVMQLDATRQADRDAAERELIALGPPVLDELARIKTERLSAAQQERLARVAQALQRAVAESSAKASLVTLHSEAMPLSEVLSALEKQTGNKLIDGRSVTDADPTLKVDFEAAPFWQALDEVLDRADLTVFPFGQEGAITIAEKALPQRPRQKAASYAGPFRVEPVSVTARRDLRVPLGQSLQVSLEVAWEPRLAPVALKQPLGDKLTVVDEQGNRLESDSAGGELEAPITPGATSVELMIPLVLPPREVNRIASLKGSFTAVLPGRIEAFRFANLVGAKNESKRIAEATVTVDEVKKADGIWAVAMRVKYDSAAGALESYRGWVLNNEAYLEGPQGQRIENAGYELTMREEDAIGITYFFELDGPPAGHTFVYKTPGMILAKQFDYDIKDIPLP